MSWCHLPPQGDYAVASVGRHVACGETGLQGVIDDSQVCHDICHEASVDGSFTGTTSLMEGGRPIAANDFISADFSEDGLQVADLAFFLLHAVDIEVPNYDSGACGSSGVLFSKRLHSDRTCACLRGGRDTPIRQVALSCWLILISIA